MTELVTAVVTTYERPRLARRAIESVVAQTYEPLEVLVVEDGSETGVGDWLAERDFADLRYLPQEENRGLAAVRNVGWRAARGDWIAFLDDDDVWKPRRVEAQMELVGRLKTKVRTELGVVYCGIEVRSPDGRTLRTRRPLVRGDLRRAVVERGGPHTLSSTFLFSRAALEQTGGFDEALPSSIDHDIWMSLADHGYRVEAVDEALVVVREQVGRETMVQDTEQRIRGVGRFVEKWEPAYRRWAGEEEGRRWARQYHATVVGRLAGDKIAVGRVGEAVRAASAALARDGARVSLRLATAAAGKVAARLLPESAFRRLLAVLGRR